jgi:hypothetical protein
MPFKNGVINFKETLFLCQNIMYNYIIYKNNAKNNNLMKYLNINKTLNTV